MEKTLSQMSPEELRDYYLEKQAEIEYEERRIRELEDEKYEDEDLDLEEE